MISFVGCHYPKSIILQAMRWYVPYALSYRNIEEMMKERGIMVDRATWNRWALPSGLPLFCIYSTEGLH